MPKIIKDRVITDDSFPPVIRDGALPPEGPVLVGLSLWREHREQLLARGEPVGVQLEPVDDALALGDDVTRLAMIAIHFPAFADGRGYSQAWLLRNRLGYRGELRAVGDVFKDNLYYLSRCGFNSFAIRADKDIAIALRGLDDFSEGYLGSATTPEPLFRRRLAT